MGNGWSVRSCENGVGKAAKGARASVVTPSALEDGTVRVGTEAATAADAIGAQSVHHQLERRVQRTAGRELVGHEAAHIIALRWGDHS